MKYIGKTILRIISVLSVISLLSACGGGGGGGSDDTGFKAPTINNTPVSITPTNETEVAQAGVNGATGSLSVGGDVPFSPIGVVVEGASTESNVKVYSLIKRVVTGAVQNKINGGTSVAGVQFSESWPCDVDGTYSESGDVTDITGNSITAGDYVAISFDGCDDGFGDILNGSMTITFNSNIADTNTFEVFEFDLSVNFNNFQSTVTNVGSFTIHGDMNISTSVMGDTFTFTMSGDSFYIVELGDAVHLTNYDVSLSVDELTSDVTLDSTFTVASNSLNGSITVDSHFEIPGGSLDPTSGYMTITGNDSVLSMVVVGDGTVDVTLTVGGVIQTDYPKNVTWNEFGVEVDTAF